VWVIGRVWYALVYLHDPARRGPAFATGMLACLALLVMASVGVGRALLLG
jgi:uncharacterized MAPEG superfamily protein